MNEENTFIDKTTAIKTVERIKFKAIPFAKGSKIEISWAFNPSDPYHIDQFLEMDEEKNEILQALNGFKRILETQLGAKILKDE
ncbi:MAG: hypothetical protein ACKO7N_05725 [Candidatus Nitrosotenuis sp.]